MQRDRSIGAIKGLAITLVVAGHAISLNGAVDRAAPGLLQVDLGHWIPLSTATGLVLSLIYSFHMPLFAFASGYVLWPRRDRSFVKTLATRARGLLLPYFGWFVVLYLVALATRPFPIGFWSGLAAIAESPSNYGALWYLYALFITCMFLLLIQSNRYSSWLVPASAIAVVVAALFGLPNTLGIGSVAWIHPFMASGYWIASHQKAVLRNRGWVIAACAAVFIPIFYVRQPIMLSDMSILGRLAVANQDPSMYLLINLTNYLCGLSASLVVFCVYAQRKGRWMDAQAWVGKRTLGIYASESLFVQLLLDHGVSSPWLLFAGALACALLITVALERIPVVNTVLLGRPLVRIAWPRWLAPGEESA